MESIYQPLNADRAEIRILRVQGNEDTESTLVCHLETVSLQSSPKYEAISYCWGEHIGTESIQLNGIAFDVPASAVKVVRQYRPIERSRTLWIDAICINQADVKEKSTQVSMMGQVYAKTKRCLIWLGDEDDTTKAVFRSLQLISDKYYDQFHKASHRHTGDVNNYFEYTSDYLTTLFTDCSVIVIGRFFEKSWFSRIWVQQEAALAPVAKCRCGTMEIPFIVVSRAARWVSSEWYSIHKTFGVKETPTVNALHIVWNFNHSGGQGKGLLLSSLLAEARFYEATDARDKLYAVLGLAQMEQASEEFMRWFIVDYDRSISSVYTDATLRSFVSEGTLAVLEQVDEIRLETRITATERIPAWVVRLDKGPMDILRYRFGSDCFCCPFPLDLGLLQRCAGCVYVLLRGFEVATVSKILLKNARKTRAVDVLGNILAAGANGHLANASFANYLLDCLTTGRKTKFLAALGEGESLEILEELTRFCTPGNVENRGANVDKDMDRRLIHSVTTIYDVALRLCKNRKLFLTSGGMIALGNSSLQENDCIAALAGGKYPCILRPHTRPKQTENDKYGGITRQSYQFVGLAYIPGIMNGEAVDAKMQAGEEPKVFEIW